MNKISKLFYAADNLLLAIAYVLSNTTAMMLGGAMAGLAVNVVLFVLLMAIHLTGEHNV